MEAVEIMRQQAALKQQRAAQKLEAVAALDAAMRGAHRYLSEFTRELNTLQPNSGASYAFVYAGRLPSVTLTEASVATRTLKVLQKELCAEVHVRFRVKPAEPPKVMLLGDDVARCEKYLKLLGVEFQMRANKDGKDRPVQFVVTSSLPCEINIRGDYEATTVTVELINVRRFGRVTVRLALDNFKEAIDDLARYVLGVDDDFSKLATLA